MKYVLIADDNRDITDILTVYVRKEGYEPLVDKNGIEAMHMFEDFAPIAILLDVMMPLKDGYEVCKDIRKRSSVPIILITARGEDFDKIMGLDIGADDYIVKPFSVKVLMEKIQTVLRRCSGAQGQKVYTAGSLSVDLENRIVKSRGNVVSLTPTEFEILEVFCRNRDQILTKDILLEKIWDRKENYVNEHTLSLNVSRLRNKIADGEHEYIKTIYGLGYKWVGGRK